MKETRASDEVGRGRHCRPFAIVNSSDIIPLFLAGPFIQQYGYQYMQTIKGKNAARNEEALLTDI
jgi:hypothetical protein